MGLAINTNIASLNAQRNLGKSQTALSKSMQRLSSGLRINSARDDAAGLAISDRMTSQIRGLNQAVRNANDGISLAQTAEGAMQEGTNILQRMRELAVQSANDSNTTADRASLQKEISQLQMELDRIARTTEFNNKKVLDDTFPSIVFQVGANKGQSIAVSVGNAKVTNIGNYQVSSVMTNAQAADNNLVTAHTMTVNGNQTSEHVDIVDDMSAREIAAAVNEKSAETNVTAEASTKLKVDNLSSSGSISFQLTGSNTGSSVTVAAVITDKDDLSGLVASINDHAGATGITANLDNSGSMILSSSAGDDILIEEIDFFHTGTTTDGDIDFTNLDADGLATGTSAQTIQTLTDDTVIAQGQVTFHSNSAYTIHTIGNATVLAADNSASGLNDVGSIDIGTQIGSGNALKVIDGAIAYLDSRRADLGAVMNRFESTIANLQNISENVVAARSRILDADIAQETSQMTKQNILQQAGVSILTQANQAPQLALSLLG